MPPCARALAVLLGLGALSRPAAAAPPLRLVAVGDIAFRGEVGRGVAQGTLDPLAALRPVLSGADLAFGNLETVLSERPVPEPETSLRGPILRAPTAAAVALARAGFDVVSIANNHVFDLYAPGLHDTVAALRRAGVAAVGAGARRDEAAAPVVREVGGMRIGFLAFAFGTNRAAHGPAYVARPFGAPALLAVRALRARADAMLVSIHWGTEGAPAPSPRQVALAHALIDAGADAVLGHHPHVLQSVELYRGRPVIYSLGNFLFGRQPRRRRLSAILHLDLAPGPAPVRRAALQAVIMDPARGIPSPAEGADAAEIWDRLRRVSRPFPVHLELRDGLLELGPGRAGEAQAASAR